ncbi:mCG112999, isoform CRA_b [Mus musculus]|nr:mCG112999, isoform CRA_b [Mus musculus]
MGFAGSFPEESLQGCDAGDLQDPQSYRQLLG